MKLIKTTLVGIGQIFLQDNGWSGLLITIGMFFSHWTLGVTCFLGSLIGVLTAKALKAKDGDIEFGLYGFNASLAYMCVMFTFASPNPALQPNNMAIVWVLGAVAAVIATVIMHVFVTKGWTAFTFPFVVTCWVLCWAFAKYEVLGLVKTIPADLPNYSGTIDAITTPFYGWAEVNFGANFFTGVFIFLGLAISSPSVAMWGTAAATLGGLFAHYVLGINPNTLANGIYSFSPILVACAFVTKSGVSRADFIYIVVGVLLAVLIHYGVDSVGLATYTIGFIVATWIMEAVQKAVNKSNPNTEELVKSLNP